MHIVHLSTRLDFYGGEVCLANLAEGCAARGHRVSCLLRPGSQLADRLAGSDVQTVSMPLLDWYDPLTVWRVNRWLRGHQVDVLATHLPRDYFIAAAASRGLPLCNVATRHRLKPLKMAWLKRPFFRNFGAIVAVSKAVAVGVNYAALVPSDRVVTVPNGVVQPVSPGSGPTLRERCGVAGEAPVVGLVGRLVPDKGAACLVTAVGKLAASWPELQVMLVGGGDPGGAYRRQLQGLADGAGWGARLHFLGFVPEAARYIREFDVQVVPSVAEPFGLATIEAMASAVPVIATTAGGSPEIIQDGVEGFLVPAGDTQALADRLSCLLASPEQGRQLGARGRERYLREFTAGQMVDRTEAVYERAVAWRREWQKGPA